MVQTPRKIPVTKPANLQRDFIGLIAKAARNLSSDVHIKTTSSEFQVLARVNGIMVRLDGLKTGVGVALIKAAFSLAGSKGPQVPTNYYGAMITAASLVSHGDKSICLPSNVKELRLQYIPLGRDGQYLIVRIIYN